jgi:hypothetical protein
MGVPNKELAFLVTFLNKKPLGRGGTILGNAYVEAINQLRQTLWNALGALVAPDATVPTEATEEAKQHHKRIVDKYLKPVNMLSHLVTLLNQNASKPRWQLKKQPGKNGKIEIDHGFLTVFTGSVSKEDFADAQGSQVWGSLAKVLETGAISKLGECLICQKFFAKNRYWQVICDDADCRREYDNRGSKDRKAKARSLAKARKLKRPIK